MNLAPCLALYGLLVSFLVPRWLPRLTAGGSSPRLAAGVWGLVLASVLASWVGAAGSVLLSMAAWSGPAAAVLRSCLAVLRVFGAAAPWVAGTILVGALLAMGGLIRVGWRLARDWAQAHRSGRAHAHTVRVLGHPAPDLGPATVVVDSPQVAAYCVAGPSRTVVVTQGARDKLTGPELAAVLAHEYAHLAGHHHLLLTLARALRRALPGLPLFAGAETHLARLLEMRADDVAVARHGTRTVIAAMASLTITPTPAGSLGMADSALLARAERLATPPSRPQRRTEQLTLTASGLALVLLPVTSTLAMAATLCPLLPR